MVIEKLALPPDDGAPFNCDMYEDAPAPIFYVRCETPSICRIAGEYVPKYWPLAEMLHKREQVYVCQQHYTWINNHYPEEN